MAQKTELSINAIRQLELGIVAARSSTTTLIRNALEAGGVEFLDSDGVKRRLDDLMRYRGPESCDMFFKDMMQTISGSNGEVLVVTQSQTVLAEYYGVGNGRNQERIAQLKAMARIKCLVWEDDVPSITVSAQFRAIPRIQIAPMGYCVYGDSHAWFHPIYMGDLQFTVHKCWNYAQAYRDHFWTLWETAIPLTA